MQALKELALYSDIPDSSTLQDKVAQLNPYLWRQRQEKVYLETQRVYEDNIQNNPLMTSHNLLGYIDKKLANPDGEIQTDMSALGDDQKTTQFANHPYEME